MQLGPRGQSAEVPGVLGDDHAVVCNASFQDTMIWLAAAANMQRMDRIVAARVVEAYCQKR